MQVLEFTMHLGNATVRQAETLWEALAALKHLGVIVVSVSKRGIIWEPGIATAYVDSISRLTSIT